MVLSYPILSIPILSYPFLSYPIILSKFKYKKIIWNLKNFVNQPQMFIQGPRDLMAGIFRPK